MIGLIQRVSQASVSVAGSRIAQIDTGLLVLVGVRSEDLTANASRLAERLLRYRVFPDADGRMNHSLQDIRGAALLVPQFTLAARTDKGNRASFTSAAEPTLARRLFEQLLRDMRAGLEDVQAGEFGADMQVSLCNSGPVTFWLEA